jgi:ubiquitin-protein ligase
MTSVKRMMKDIQLMEQSELQGVYFKVSDESMFDVHLMIVGPSDTPYQNGLYFFTLNFDKEKHPFVPPKAKFYQGLQGTRFHPNFYSNGKVCLSLFNTWQGPKWSACQTLLSIASVILSLFDDNPLVHEPGFDDPMHIQKQNEYKQIISYMNIRNIIEVMYSMNDSNIFGLFEKEIDDHVQKNQVNIENFIVDKFVGNHSRYNLSIYNMRGVYDGDKLHNDFRRVFF